jgi:adenosylcobyric acid synthase
MTRQVTFEWNGSACSGYEIHQGVSDVETMVVEKEGVIGTYVHGFLDNPAVIEWLLNKNPHTQRAINGIPANPQEFKEKEYDRLADHVRHYVDIPKLYEIMSHD